LVQAQVQHAEAVDREPIPAHIERARNPPGEMITYERRELIGLSCQVKGKSKILPEGDARLRKPPVAPHRV
jgi:hypothetical protein